MIDTQAPPVAPTRLYYIDKLRVALTVLVVAHHCAVTYSLLPAWFYLEPADDPTAAGLTAFVIVNQTWFMGLFFLISGVFVPGSYQRKGGDRFLRDRLLRLGVPLLGFVLLIRPLVNLPQLIPSLLAGEQFSFLEYYVTVGDPGPMWFVEVLLVFSFGYVLVRRLRPVSTAGTEPRPVTAAMIAGVIAVLAVTTILWRLLVPIDSYWPVVGLPSPAYLPQYLLFFVIGTYAGSRGWLQGLTRRQGRIGWLLALIGAALFGWGTWAADSVPPFAGWVADLGEAALAVGLIIGLVVLYRDHANRAPSAFAKLCSEQAFAVYVIHPLVLVTVALLLRPVAAPAVVKFGLLLAISLPLCWGLAALLRRIPAARRVL